MRSRWSTLFPLCTVALAAVVGVACGADGDDSGTAAMTEGQRIAVNNGCASCHGVSGEGGMGPTWRGLFNSERELDDGTIVIADDAYLVRAIVDPRAEQLKGYSVMPPNSLTDQQVRAIVDYIKTLTA